MNLQEFIEKYESDAMILDLTKEELPNRILQTQIFKFNNAEFESERIEVEEFVKKAIKELKHRLQLSINNESYKTKYKGFTAPYLLDIRLLIEYRKLIKFLEEYESDTKDRTKVNLDLKDFLVNPPDEYKLPKIQQKFNKAKGKEMANAIYLLRYLGILTYDINSKTKGRGNLAKLLNPNIKMNGVNMFFVPGTYELKNAFDDDLDPIKKWLNSL